MSNFITSNINKNKVFPFPGIPYPQQNDLMNEIYDCIDNSQIGVFESPTGTGKSLSAICSSLYWLQNEEKRIVNEYQSVSENSSDKYKANDDWLLDMISQSTKQSNNEQNNIKTKDKMIALENYNKFIQTINNYKHTNILDKESNKTIRSSIPFTKKSTAVSVNLAITNEEKDFMLPDYDSDNDNIKDDDSEIEKDNINSMIPLPQLIYCSRTHSQISQFVNEIKKYPTIDTIRCVTIGSRNNLCINESLKSKYKNDMRLSEACIELCKHKEKSGSKRKSTNDCTSCTGNCTFTITSCSYHNIKQEKNTMYKILSTIQDIEDIVSLGRTTNTCPYYSTRQATKQAQVICMPYNILLNNENRSIYKIKLTNNIIIIDEAHNLIDTMNQIYSCELDDNVIKKSIKCINIYLLKFKLLLNYKNLLYISILLSFLNKLNNYLQSIIINSDTTDYINTNSTNYITNNTTKNTTNNSHINQKLLLVNNFLFDSKLDNINIYKLYNYLVKYNFIYRIGGYVEHITKKEHINSTTNDETIGYVNSLKIVLQFIKCLHNNDFDGRIVVCKNQNIKSIKFVLFNPSNHFYSIISQARSVILLGGTMKPFNYILTSLFPTHMYDKIKTFSCNHIISSDKIVTYVVKHQVTNNNLFSFTYNNKYNHHMIYELYLLLLNHIVNSVSKGVIVFFTSYNYMNHIINYLKSQNLYNLLNNLKSIYVESKDQSLDIFLTSYSNDVNNKPNGAMLFCVMGGKLSEGINFSDDLGRCIVLVGLPYPDSNDLVLNEKMKTNKSIYDSLCLKLINQSIGRSIRHINDYSTIVLVDCRYDNDHIIAQLPNWISSNILTLQYKENLSVKLQSFLGKFLNK